MTSQNDPTANAAHPERQYLDILRELLEEGTRKGDRTGTGTRSLFGRSMRFDLSEGFPLLTTKRIHVRSVVHELLWFLSGDTNVRYLRENGVSIWDEWADANGDLGPVYGKQWRSWAKPDGGTIDQVSQVVDEIRRNPDSRRLVVSAWNPADLDRMALAPCHCLFQFNTRPMTKAERLSSAGLTEEEVDDVDMFLGINHIPDRFLDLQLYQRSADVFLGVPFNVASYALLLALVARHCNCHPGDFVHTFGDLHLYENHLDAARTQLAREPGTLPRLTLAPRATDLFSFRYEDIAFEGYDPQPAIKAPVAV